MTMLTKKIITFLFLIACLSSLCAAEDDTLNFRVTRRDSLLSSSFDMTNEKKQLGSVTKSFFHIVTHYDLLDRYGLYEGQGICRMVTLGLFYSWATEIDIYNAHGTWIGIIDGQIISSEPAKFSFYDAEGRRICIAYLDQNRMSFVLVDPENPQLIFARLTRNFIKDTLDNWDVTIYQPDRVPLRFIKIFAAFACDTQNSFKPDL